MPIFAKRVYAAPSKDDGLRVLVDRLWPRGLSKEKAQADLWLKDIAPSNELRVWFNHEEGKWNEFQARYARELDARPEAVKTLLDAARGHDTLTLLYGAKDETHNQAVALKRYMESL